jgi:phytoene dehydrogenase-like protein
MSERKDERWLDKQLRRTIDGSTPRFDAEGWKQKHRDEYQALLARREQPVGRGLPHGFRMSRWSTTIGALAAAAVILLAVGLLVPAPPTARAPAPPTPPPANPAGRMMSMMSLRMAYQRGGIDALDRQLQDSLDVFRPRSSSLSVQELLNDMNESENRKG